MARNDGAVVDALLGAKKKPPYKGRLRSCLVYGAYLKKHGGPQDGVGDDASLFAGLFCQNICFQAIEVRLIEYSLSNQIG